MNRRYIFYSALVVAVFALLLAAALPVHAATLTVTNTNDSGPGSLRQVVADANSGDTIAFNLIYPATIKVTSDAIEIKKNLTINGPGTAKLTIEGSNSLAFESLDIYCPSCVVTVTGLNFQNDIDGGQSIYSTGTLTVSDSTFVGASAKSESGIYNAGGTLTVSNSSFTGACGWSGGGIYSYGPANISSSTFSMSDCGSGAAIYNSSAAMTVTNSTFDGNGHSFSGGAIYNSSGTLIITGSTFSNNTSEFSGGAIYNGGGTLTVTNSTFSGNSAGTDGGAIDNDTGSTLTVTNSTFSGNSATSHGDAIYNTGTATLVNSIVASSTAGHDCYGNAFAPASTNNLATDATCSGGFTQVTSAQLALGTLTGSPAYYPLNPGSAAIDAGTNTGCPAVDQRGQPRPIDGDGDGIAVCDVGSYEYVPQITVENDHPSVQYDGWLGVQSANASGGSYRISKKINDKVTYKFTGTSVRWVTLKGPDQGKAQVTIDGVSRGTFDLYSPTVQWQFVPKTFSGLANKAHTLVVKVLGTKNAKSKGVNVAVDAFIVGTVNQVTTEDKALSVQYDTWLGATQANASGGSYHSSQSAGAVARFAFTGTGVTWVTAKGPVYGKADVYIDGKKKATYDLNQAAQQWQAAIPFTGLSAGAHTIEIHVLGTKKAASKGKTVIVDAFRIP
jgi:predicted outer membrane repeat protein